MTRAEIQCVNMCGSDYRMDQIGIRKPVNPLPQACDFCHFPDLDHVPQPYWLGKGIESQVEIAEAEVGNLLVRERVKRILETVAPDQCRFYPTHRRKTLEETTWFLGVPVNTIETGAVKSSIPRCNKCHQPLHAHGTQHAHRQESPATMFELCKSKNWISTGEKPVRDLDRYVDLRHALELHRHIYFSVRLVLLLKELRIRSTVYQSIACKEKPTPSDELWVRDQLKRLSDEPADTPQTSHEPWFQDYLAKHRKTKKKAENGTLDRLGQRVPDSYKRFASSIGSKTYRNIDGQEGTNVRILSPQDVDFATFKGRIKDDLDQEAGADGIVFAVTDFGDQFCFKPLAGTFEVYRYDHEMDDFEPYAASFESCIRAWVEKPPK